MVVVSVGEAPLECESSAQLRELPPEMAGSEPGNECAVVPETSDKSDEDSDIDALLEQPSVDPVAMSERLIRRSWVSEDMCKWTIFEDIEDELQYHRRRSVALCHFVRAVQIMTAETRQMNKELRRLNKGGVELQEAYIRALEEAREAAGDAAYWKEMAAMAGAVDAEVASDASYVPNTSSLASEGLEEDLMSKVPTAASPAVLGSDAGDQSSVELRTRKLPDGDLLPLQSDAVSTTSKSNVGSVSVPLPKSLVSSGAMDASIASQKRSPNLTLMASPPAAAYDTVAGRSKSPYPKREAESKEETYEDLRAALRAAAAEASAREAAVRAAAAEAAEMTAAVAKGRSESGGRMMTLQDVRFVPAASPKDGAPLDMGSMASPAVGMPRSPATTCATIAEDGALACSPRSEESSCTSAGAHPESFAALALQRDRPLTPKCSQAQEGDSFDPRPRALVFSHKSPPRWSPQTGDDRTVKKAPRSTSPSKDAGVVPTPTRSTQVGFSSNTTNFAGAVDQRGVGQTVKKPSLAGPGLGKPLRPRMQLQSPEGPYANSDQGGRRLDGNSVSAARISSQAVLANKRSAPSFKRR